MLLQWIENTWSTRSIFGRERKRERERERESVYSKVDQLMRFFVITSFPTSIKLANQIN